MSRFRTPLLLCVAVTLRAAASPYDSVKLQAAGGDPIAFFDHGYIATWDENNE